MELPDYCQLWDETYTRALEGKLSPGDTEDSFWSNQENVDRFVKHLLNKKGGRIEDNIASMHIPPGSTVLDIGAGPGTLAVPLASAGCRVTTIEPSIPMGEAMEHYRQHMQAPPISEIRKRWENVTPQEAGLHDYVIASRSLMFGNLRENMLKMGTKKLIEAALEAAMEKGAAVEYINIAKLNFKGCLGCNECKKDQTKFCCLKDDMSDLYAKLNEADVILLGSPVFSAI